MALINPPPSRLYQLCHVFSSLDYPRWTNFLRWYGLRCSWWRTSHYSTMPNHLRCSRLRDCYLASLCNFVWYWTSLYYHQEGKGYGEGQDRNWRDERIKGISINYESNLLITWLNQINLLWISRFRQQNISISIHQIITKYQYLIDLIISQITCHV